jgi:RHH-type transcriptional regulator, proline utilization regulon repressor / proline dehydrogenase / delta 1-pyrroline-5-carboxylate dehydrogenase
MTMTERPVRDHYDDPAGIAELSALVPDVEATVRRWLEHSRTLPVDKAAARLAAMLNDPRGLAFTVGFVDGVIRPEDVREAARTFAQLARDVPGFLPWHLRAAVKVGAAVGKTLPGVVIPAARIALRGMVGHLVADARDRQLGRVIRRLRGTSGTRLNLNLLGEAVLGEHEAARRLDGTRRLLARDDVDYVSIKVSSTVAPHNPWAFDEAVAHIVSSLTPLFRQAAAASPAKFINLDMEEYHDLRLTVAVFSTLLDQPEFLGLSAGIVLQAYLPDALATMITVQEWAASRRARGGAGIKVRLVKGANLPMERVDASVHGWPLATWSTKQDTDTNYKRVLDYALQPSRIANVRVGVAGHNLFDIAFAWHLAGLRSVRDGIEFEMLLGMAAAQAQAVRRDVGGLLLYTPVVHPNEFDTAIAYLVRRLEEGASSDNFMSALFQLGTDESLYARERDRFLASLKELDRTIPPPSRRQDRAIEVVGVMSAFANTPDTDPSLPANASWGREILGRVPSSDLGRDLVTRSTVSSAEVLETRIAAAVRAGSAWGARSGADRGQVLRRAAAGLAAARGSLVEVMAAECGKTLDESDPEVSEAIDFANYYAELASALDEVDGASASPVALTVVTPPWNFPVAIPAGSVLAALAAGSAVIIKPAPQAVRCGAVLVDALLSAGVPADALQLVNVSEGELGQRLVADPRVDRLILTGAYDTASLFRQYRRDLPLLAETSGKNAIVVTPSADIDLAVRDVVRSAFGHAGQKCSAASLAILVGSVATSARFRAQLVDAVTSLTVAWPFDATSQMGPVISPPQGKLLEALTTLSPGERWLVEPRQLDATGRLWSPGVKDGVAPGSPFHLTEYFGPVLGLMSADSLSHAIELQNATPYGLTAGLFSLDPGELALWCDSVEAGNLYVNRGTTGAIVRRQPFGGWKRSSVGAGAKAGGPNYLVGLTNWATRPSSATAVIGPVASSLLAAAREAGVGNLDMIARALRSDASAWTSEFGPARDVSGLEAERNVLRYRPHEVNVRLASDSVADLVRVVAAGVVAGGGTGAGVGVSSAVALPAPVARAFAACGVGCVVESRAAWEDRLRALPGGRVRLIGGDASQLHDAIDGRPDIAVYAQDVTESGRVEMLPFLREQAISITAHRFGTPHRLAYDFGDLGPAADRAS